jgi:hypothetical protein
VPLWTFWRRDKVFALAGNRAPAVPAHRLVTTPTTLCVCVCTPYLMMLSVGEITSSDFKVVSE